MFGTLGGQELLLILVLALIVFGPRKLPEIGKSIGRMMSEFRRASNDFKRTIEDEVESERYRAPEPPREVEAPPSQSADTSGGGETGSPTTPGGGSSPTGEAPPETRGHDSPNPPETAAPEAPTVSREEAPAPIEPK